MKYSYTTRLVLCLIALYFIPYLPYLIGKFIPVHEFGLWDIFGMFSIVILGIMSICFLCKALKNETNLFRCLSDKVIDNSVEN